PRDRSATHRAQGHEARVATDRDPDPLDHDRLRRGSEQGDGQRGAGGRRLPRAAEAGAAESLRGLLPELDGRRLPRVAGRGCAQGRPLHDPEVDLRQEIVGAPGARPRPARRGPGVGRRRAGRGRDLDGPQGARRGGAGDLDVSRGIDLLQTETPRVKSERGPHVHGFGNPHYWLDPANARPMTQTILDGLARLSPDAREAFGRNRARFLEQLDAGLRRWTDAMAPHHGARVVAFHDSWPYFARRFGLVIAATVEPVPGVPPTPASLAALTAGMKDAAVRVLIIEPSASRAVADRVAAPNGARVVTLVPSVGGNAEARDYLTLFDVNVQRLSEALAGTR